MYSLIHINILILYSLIHRNIYRILSLSLSLSHSLSQHGIRASHVLMALRSSPIIPWLHRACILQNWSRIIPCTQIDQTSKWLLQSFVVRRSHVPTCANSYWHMPYTLISLLSATYRRHIVCLYKDSLVQFNTHKLLDIHVRVKSHIE